MEEDIKIVKKFVKSSKPTKDREFYAIITTKTKMEAIENILNRLEQLEKENENLVLNVLDSKKYIDNECIPKSVIREKIEELEAKIISSKNDNKIGDYLVDTIKTLTLKGLLGG